MRPDSRLPITVTVITYNEEKNIGRAIASVSGLAEEIIVVDSGSEDRTVELAQAAGARVIQNVWPGYGQQKNFAQAQARHNWILNLDADEEVGPELDASIRAVFARDEHTETGGGPWGYYFARKTFYLGRWIRRGGWYPNYLVRLCHKGHARWTEPHVHESLEVDEGRTALLPGDLHHYTFSSIQEQILANLRYSRRGSQDLQKRGDQPSLIRLVLKPIGKFLETYVLKKGFLDGLPGFIISINAAHSMFLKYAYLFENTRFSPQPGVKPQGQGQGKETKLA
ncbi:MAG: glycosyltransferase family 2 protein [Bdellovibrionota bacterium]